MTAEKVRSGMENRFEYVIAGEKLINEDLGYYDSTVSVIRDKQTGIMYLSKSGGGITPLLDENGYPMRQK